MTKGHDAWNTTYYHRAIRTRIGEALRAHLDDEQAPLPHRLLTLLMQLNEQENSEPEAAEEGGEARPPGDGVNPSDHSV